MIGQTISHYRIIEKLGEGGMGVVYKAEDTKLRRTVALKFLTPQAVGSGEEKTRFVHEAQAAAALDHPNICTVYEIDDAEGQTFISMAYVDGQSLKEKLEVRPLKVEEALDIAIQTGEGLQEAHERGIVHRDIKSANIMVTKKGQAKITDFGLAQLSDRTKITKSGTTLGTTAYMSTEQARGETVDHRSDIFSFGVLLYEMLTGQLPFKGDYEQAVIYSLLNEDPEPITSLRTGVPMELERIVIKALSKDPRERYQHVDEMLVDLKKLSSQKDVEVEPRPKRRLPTRPLLITAAVLVLAVLVAGLVKTFLVQQPISPDQKRAIAVMYFDNLTRDPSLDWLQKGVVEMLNAGLSRSQELYVLDTQRLFDILKEMGKEQSPKIDQTSATEIAKRANIGTMILGNILKIGPKIRLQTKVIDAETGELLLAEHADGTGDEDIFAMVAHLTNRIQTYLEIKTAGEELTETWMRHITTNSVEAFRYFVRAREFLHQSHWQEAKDLYEKAVAIDSTFATAYVELAAANWNLGDYRAMDEAYKHALQLRDKASSKDKLMIDIFGAVRSGDTQKQIVLAQELLRYSPQSKFWTYILGRGYYFDNQLNKAIEVWQKLAKKRWHWVWTYVYLGDAYLKLNRYDDAIDAYRTGIEAVPEYSALYAMLAIAFSFKGDQAKSNFYHEEFLSETLKHKENAGQIYETAGFKYLSAKLYEQALDSFKDGVAAVPEDPRVHYGVGKAYYALANYRQAIRAYRKVLQIDSTRYHAHDQLALAYEKLGDKEKAIDALSRFLKQAEHSPDLDDARRRLTRLKNAMN